MDQDKMPMDSKIMDRVMEKTIMILILMMQLIQLENWKVGQRKMVEFQDWFQMGIWALAWLRMENSKDG